MMPFCVQSRLAVGLVLGATACVSPVAPASDEAQHSMRTELVAAPSFDECYPPRMIGRRKTEPPLFMLSNQREPFEILTVMIHEVTLADPASGWTKPFDELEFAGLWELSKEARRLDRSGTDLTGGDPAVDIMAIDCGDAFSWHVRISARAAESAQDATRQLAHTMFGLLQMPR
jgi:hypothetical protein